MNEELKFFIGSKYEYYFNKWQKIDFGKKGKSSLNIFALSFSLPWIAYRNFTPAIFLLALFTSILLVIQNLIKLFYPELKDIQDILKYYLPILPSVILGFYGNYWYYLFARKQVEKLKIKFPVGDVLKVKLEKKGNPGVFFLFLNVALFIILLMVMIGFWELLFQLFFGLSVITVE